MNTYIEVFAFIHVIAFKVINAISDEIPSAKVEISNAEIHSLNAWFDDAVFQNLKELLTIGYVIVDFRHK